MAMTRNAIASARRSMGYTQEQFSSYTGKNQGTYSLHERYPDQFRVGELQSIVDKLDGADRLQFANAIVEEIIGKDFTVCERA